LAVTRLTSSFSQSLEDPPQAATAYAPVTSSNVRDSECRIINLPAECTIWIPAFAGMTRIYLKIEM
jgi:hypothetical protein